MTPELAHHLFLSVTRTTPKFSAQNIQSKYILLQESSLRQFSPICVLERTCNPRTKITFYFMQRCTLRFRFDLPNTLSRHRELLADFFERVVGVHADAEAHA